METKQKCVAKRKVLNQSKAKWMRGRSRLQCIFSANEKFFVSDMVAKLGQIEMANIHLSQQNAWALRNPFVLGTFVYTTRHASNVMDGSGEFNVDLLINPVEISTAKWHVIQSTNKCGNIDCVTFPMKSSLRMNIVWRCNGVAFKRWRHWCLITAIGIVLIYVFLCIHPLSPFLYLSSCHSSFTHLLLYARFVNPK